jgi:hypothetical protein
MRFGAIASAPSLVWPRARPTWGSQCRGRNAAVRIGQPHKRWASVVDLVATRRIRNGFAGWPSWMYTPPPSTIGRCTRSSYRQSWTRRTARGPPAGRRWPGTCPSAPRPPRSISGATVTISSSDGVIRPDSPITSTPSCHCLGFQPAPSRWSDPAWRRPMQRALLPSRDARRAKAFAHLRLSFEL